MDVLKDESKRAYPYISRYAPFPYYYNIKDGKYVYGLTSRLSDDCTYALHTVKESDTLDSLSEHYYGRPDLYWIIADFNKIVDVIDTKLFNKYKTLKIPSMSDLRFIDN